MSRQVRSDRGRTKCLPSTPSMNPIYSPIKETYRRTSAMRISISSTRGRLLPDLPILHLVRERLNERPWFTLGFEAGLRGVEPIEAGLFLAPHEAGHRAKSASASARPIQPSRC